jgi:hypothetical protein
MRRVRRSSAVAVLAALAISTAVGPPAAATSGAGRILAENCGHGVHVLTFRPPRGFDPLTASNAALVRWGYPTRPARTADRATWRRFVQHPLPTSPCSAMSARTPKITYHPSVNWAGYVATGHAYKAISGTWHVPVASLPSSVAYGAASAWVGIGSGDSSTQPLLQGGSEEIQNSPGVDSYSTWWEVYPANSMQHFRGPVHANDLIYAYISIGSSSATLQVFDETANTGGTVTWTGRRATNNQAEWILERPTIGGRTLPLAATGVTITSSFAGTSTSTSSFKSAGSWPGYYVRSHNCNSSSKIIATPSALTNSGFNLKITRSSNAGDQCAG